MISPYYTVSESRTIIALSNGEKIKTQGKKISYIFPQSEFCALFSATIKIIGEKIWFYVPYCLHFFQVSHNFMKNCSCSVCLSLIFSFPFSFLYFSPFLSARALFSWYFFPIRPYLFPPPGERGGGYFPIYRPLDNLRVLRTLQSSPTLYHRIHWPIWTRIQLLYFCNFTSLLLC